VLVSKVPIDRFLRLCLANAEHAEYVGMVLVIARKGDHTRLLADVQRYWQGLHGVTRDLLALVVPATGSELIRSGRATAGEVDGIWVPDGIGPELGWARGFFRVKSGFWTPTPAPDNRRSGGFEQSQPTPDPPAGGGVGAALTRAANAMKELLGLSERHVPCVAVLSLWEKEAFVLPVGESFDLYGFLKALVEAFEVQEVKLRLDTLRRELQEARSERSRLDSTLVREAKERDKATISVASNWNQQVDAFIRDLPQELQPTTMLLLEALKTTPPQYPKVTQGTLTALEEVRLAAAKTPDYSDRVLRRLVQVERAISEGFPEQRAAQTRAVEAWEKVQAHPATQRLSAAEQQMKNAKGLARLSKAIKAAVEPNHLRSVDSTLLRESPWRTTVLEATSIEPAKPASQRG
jgi:hypothetical protein